MVDIPDGYTFVRCDQYSPDEFINLFGIGLMRDICEEYIAHNPKELYNTDDEIAVRHTLEDRQIPGLLHGQNRNTTKRTWYTD